VHTKQSILLIGRGRLAKHLQHWNSLLSEPNILLHWDLSQNQLLLLDSLNKCTLVWLAISDSALVPFYEQHLQSSNKKVVHFSGAFNDPRMASAHPLMSFTQTLLPNEVYTKIHFAVNQCESLQAVLPGFQNSFTILTAENKSYYHALCVIAGNFPQLLWNEVSNEMKSLNLPPAALDLYINQISANYISLKNAALTGPLVRKDHSTIEKNIQSLSRAEGLQNIYKTFTKEFSK
jgi:2-dehydropantoate 2-reductase